LAEPCAGVVASIGGKYTSARADAALLVDNVCESLGRDAGPCPTAWREFPWRPDGRYRSWQRSTLSQGLRLGLDEETTQACQLRYGKHFGILLRMIEKMPKLAQRYVAEAPICLGELAYSSQYEMVGNLSDLLRRRLPLTMITSLSRSRVELAAEVAGNVLRWTEDRRVAEVRSVCDEDERR
jgi:glycerol-3-phosphate dehydrogenase